MFTKENHEDDSSLTVNLTNNNQIHDMQRAQLRDLILRIRTYIHSRPTLMGALAARSSQVDYGERKRIEEFCPNYQSSYALEFVTDSERVLISAIRQKTFSYSPFLYTSLNPRIAETFAGDGSDDNPMRPYSSDRYDDLVDRYHNNVHFMNFIAQLISDLILFRLPTSVHSQSTMMGAFAARSSQVDYGERKQIEDFCRKYQSSSALIDYTEDSFYYRVLNFALRQQRYDIIYQYRHAIIDVIKCLRKLAPFRDKTGSWILYRGQQMTIFELEKIKNNIGELVSCLSFFSTSLDPRIAKIFAGDGSDDNPCLVSVIFEIRLNTSQPMRPYARIETSFEEEVLFSPGTRFCLMSCRKLHDNGRLWLFELVAISEKQQEQLILNHGETFLLLSSARGWPVPVVVVHHIIT
jgi:hypothetical protein